MRRTLYEIHPEQILRMPAVVGTDLDLPRIWIKPYYPAFNGLRGVAVMMVFLSHYSGFFNHSLAPVTWEGVDLFFVLSGFLITGILYDSLGQREFFKNFYIRRALRIFPVFYGFFLLLLLLTPILHLQYDVRLGLFALYVGNLTVPFTDLVHHNPTIIFIVRSGRVLPIMNIGHLWSLCVEEQFYLVWPAVVWWVRDRKRLMQVCVLLCVATLAGRCWLTLRAPRDEISHGLLFWSTYARCDTLLIGAWFAVWLRGTALSLCRLRRISAWLFCGSMLALSVVLGFSSHPIRVTTNPVMTSIGYTLVALAAAGVLLRSLDESGRLSHFLQHPALCRLGTISYGFYMLHSLPIAFWKRFAPMHPDLRYGIPFVQFGLTLGLAILSFRYFESPFLRLKRILAPQVTAEDAGARHLHVSEPEPAS